MYNGTSRREIERELGIAHGTMTDMVRRMREPKPISPQSL